MKDTHMLNLWQTTALDTYKTGDFAYLMEHVPQALLPREIERCGDGLLRFILAELSTNADCTDATTAIRRLTCAAQDLIAIAQRIKAVADIPADDGMRRVYWTIDVVATDARTAALQALAAQRNPQSIATQFEVLDPATGQTEVVDLGLTPLDAGELRAVLRDAI